MSSFWKRLPYFFGVVTLGLGVAMIVYVVTFSILRGNYLDRNGSMMIPWSGPEYYDRFGILIMMSSMTAIGAGLLTMSMATFWLLNRSDRSVPVKSIEKDL